MNPDPLTLRNLYWMANGKQKTDWDHTCSVIATLMNANRGRNQPLVRPQQLHPLRRQTSAGMSFDPETVRSISDALKAREANALKAREANKEVASV